MVLAQLRPDVRARLDEHHHSSSRGCTQCGHGDDLPSG
ncbi:hypothetical protein PpBr36_02190 [Pyricularia pennisetigena]|nr:hypothetical protein PpBr36_02190 [Pyricularia pennisetigena]TLS31132.1 hypothetical protein PpBr36_02190 [Pyricularia pennisetigena]